MITKKEVEKLSGENEKSGDVSPDPRRFLILEEKFIARIFNLTRSKHLPGIQPEIRQSKLASDLLHSAEILTHMQLNHRALRASAGLPDKQMQALLPASAWREGKLETPARPLSPSSAALWKVMTHQAPTPAASCWSLTLPSPADVG